MTEKTVKAKSSVPASDDNYPEIEKFFPFNPLGSIFWYCTNALVLSLS